MLASIIVVIVAMAVALWVLGAREPVYHLRKANWFVAVRGAVAADPAGTIWSANSDFALIGAGDPYWTRFLLVTGETAPNLNGVDDAYVARLRMFAPPPIALGLLRFLIAAGTLSRPSTQDVITNAEALRSRTDIMPNSIAIAALHARPADYAPAMVNFLSYYDQSKDGQGTGAAAYRRYGMVALRTVYRTGGHLLFYGAVKEVIRVAKAGPTMGVWADIAAMRYPNPRAILSMEHVPEYRAALKHRDAGLERTVVVASRETA
jgi:hypothetical protein